MIALLSMLPQHQCAVTAAAQQNSKSLGRLGTLNIGDGMNRNWVRFHLKEAHGALEQLVQEVEGDPEFDDAVYWPAMQHLYHHINMAWNARDAHDSEVEPIKDVDFNRWSQFPTDLPMMEV